MKLANIVLTTFVTLSPFTLTTANAQSVSDAAEAITQGWSGTATLGATSSTGNAEASSISGAIRLGKTVGRWEHLVFGSLFKGNSTLIVEQRDATGEVVTDDDGRPVRTIVKGDSSDRIALGYQPKYYWKPKTFFFGILDWESDDPANIDSASRQIVGIGHRFISNKQGYLSGELGIGNKNLDPVFGDEINGAIGYLGMNFLHRFTDKASFNADLRSDFGDENTFVELGLGLSFQVAEGMALKIGHFTRNNSDIRDLGNPLSSGSDSVTSLNLVFDI